MKADSVSRQNWLSLSRGIRYLSQGEVDGNIHISLKNRYMYVETPKVACSTLKLTLARLELEDADYYREDIHNRYLSPLLRPAQVGDFEKFRLRTDIVKFSFVRNPYERLLSAYLDKVLGGNRVIVAELLRQMGVNQLDRDVEIDFATFVSCIEETPISMMNAHWRPQYYQTLQDTIDYDVIGRLESLEEDMLRVGEMLSIDLAPYIKSWDLHHTGARDQLEEFYTDDLRRRVAEIYAKDFEYFGYDTELQGL